MKQEQRLQNQVCDYLRLQYPSVMFMISPSGIKLTIGQAKSVKRNQNPSKGWPDLFIASPNTMYCGLFIELKADGTRIFKRNGEFSSDHIEIQAAVHGVLHMKKYKACFAVGFDQAKKIIDEYLK